MAAPQPVPTPASAPCPRRAVGRHLLPSPVLKSNPDRRARTQPQQTAASLPGRGRTFALADATPAPVLSRHRPRGSFRGKRVLTGEAAVWEGGRFGVSLTAHPGKACPAAASRWLCRAAAHSTSASSDGCAAPQFEGVHTGAHPCFAPWATVPARHCPSHYSSSPGHGHQVGNQAPVLTSRSHHPNSEL